MRPVSINILRVKLVSSFPVLLQSLGMMKRAVSDTARPWLKCQSTSNDEATQVRGREREEKKYT